MSQSLTNKSYFLWMLCGGCGVVHATLTSSLNNEMNTMLGSTFGNGNIGNTFASPVQTTSFNSLPNTGTPKSTPQPTWLPLSNPNLLTSSNGKSNGTSNAIQSNGYMDIASTPHPLYLNDLSNNTPTFTFTPATNNTTVLVSTQVASKTSNTTATTSSKPEVMPSALSADPEEASPEIVTSSSKAAALPTTTTPHPVSSSPPIVTASPSTAAITSSSPPSPTPSTSKDPVNLLSILKDSPPPQTTTNAAPNNSSSNSDSSNKQTSTPTPQIKYADLPSNIKTVVQQDANQKNTSLDQATTSYLSVHPDVEKVLAEQMENTGGSHSNLANTLSQSGSIVNVLLVSILWILSSL